MNAHDSEKVIGTLVAKGYAQVETFEDASLVLYNTCSIRDKAEQKVFSRLQSFKKAGKDKVFGVLGCVAQQEGEKIFERAPHVSLVCGSASYTKLPEMLVQMERVASPESRVANGFANDHHQLEGKSPVEQSADSRFLASLGMTTPNEKSRRIGIQDLVRITGLDDRQTDKC